VANRNEPSSRSCRCFRSSNVNSAWSPWRSSPRHAVSMVPSGFTRTAPTSGLGFPSARGSLMDCFITSMAFSIILRASSFRLEGEELVTMVFDGIISSGFLSSHAQFSTQKRLCSISPKELHRWPNRIQLPDRHGSSRPLPGETARPLARIHGETRDDTILTARIIESGRTAAGQPAPCTSAKCRHDQILHRQQFLAASRVRATSLSLALKSQVIRTLNWSSHIHSIPGSLLPTTDGIAAPCGLVRSRRMNQDLRRRQIECQTRISFRAIWDDETPLWIAAIKRFSVDHGEVKSMHTVQSAAEGGEGDATSHHRDRTTKRHLTS